MVTELLTASEAGPDNPKWHELRRAGISASEIAAVLGISKWDSPFSLYWRKVNGWDVETNEDMSTGTRLEPVIADWWTDTNDPNENLAVVRAGLYANPDRAWQLATPDRLVCMACDACDAYVPNDFAARCAVCRGTGLASGPLALLECKWTGSWDGWGDPGTDDIPVYYRAQVLWQCDVLDVDVWHLAVLGPGGFRAYSGRRDQRDLAVMREHGRRFMDRIEAGDAPDVDEHTATITALKRLHPELVDEEAEISEATAALYRRARALKTKADGLAVRAEARLRAEMTDRRVAVHDGRRLASRSIYDTTRIDTARLRAEHPEVAADCVSTSTTDRLTPARSKS